MSIQNILQEINSIQKRRQNINALSDMLFEKGITQKELTVWKPDEKVPPKKTFSEQPIPINLIVWKSTSGDYKLASGIQWHANICYFSALMHIIYRIEELIPFLIQNNIKKQYKENSYARNTIQFLEELYNRSDTVKNKIFTKEEQEESGITETCIIKAGFTFGRFQDPSDIGTPMLNSISDICYLDSINNISSYQFNATGQTEQMWNMTFNKVKEWKRKYGTFPQIITNDNEEKYLGEFCSRQKTAKRNGILSIDKIEKLDSINGWNWESIKKKIVSKWDDNFDKTKQWIIINKKTPNYKSSNEIEKTLGLWYKNQEIKKNQNKLSDDQIKQFENIREELDNLLDIYKNICILPDMQPRKFLPPVDPRTFFLWTEKTYRWYLNHYVPKERFTYIQNGKTEHSDDKFHQYIRDNEDFKKTLHNQRQSFELLSMQHYPILPVNPIMKQTTIDDLIKKKTRSEFRQMEVGGQYQIYIQKTVYVPNKYILCDIREDIPEGHNVQITNPMYLEYEDNGKIIKRKYELIGAAHYYQFHWTSYIKHNTGWYFYDGASRERMTNIPSNHFNNLFTLLYRECNPNLFPIIDPNIVSSDLLTYLTAYGVSL